MGGASVAHITYHMKTTTLPQFCLICLAFAFQASGGETNFPVTISWKQKITNSVLFTEFPALIMKIKIDNKYEGGG